MTQHDEEPAKLDEKTPPTLPVDPKYLDIVINKRTVIAAIFAIILIGFYNYHTRLDATQPVIQFFFDFSIALMKEIGVAILVALAVFAIFEYFSKRGMDESLGRRFISQYHQFRRLNLEQRRWIEGRISTIASNVFFGVFQRNFPKRYVEEVAKLVLERPFIRSKMHISYKLEDDVVKLAVDGEHEELSFVRLFASATYMVENISDASQAFKIEVGLPNPIIPDLISKTDVFEVAWKLDKDASWTVMDWAALRSAVDSMHRTMSDDKVTLAGCTVGEVSIGPSERLSVRMSYVMAKEPEDTEFVSMSVATEELTLEVRDASRGKRVIRARAVHKEQLRAFPDPADESLNTLIVKHYLLPRQGVIFWWKLKRGRRGTPIQGTHQALTLTKA